MPPLQVVSQPNNVPTLAPTVALAPQQQTAPLKVQTAPVVPQPAAIPVQSAPVQPQPEQLPVQQAQPQQQSLSVQLPPIVTAIQTAINRGADPSAILQAIIQQNPNTQTPIQQALSRGGTPQQVLQQIVQQNSGLPPNPQDAPPQHVGFIQSLIQSIARPFLRPAVSLYNAGAATVKGLQGDSEAGMKEATQERDLGYFGKVKPILRPGVDAAGDAAEIAANFVGGEGASVAGENLIKAATGDAVKAAVKEGTKSGTLAGFGSALQDDNPSIGKTIEKTVEGGIGGGVTGGVLSGLPALVIDTVKAAKNTVAPSVETALTKAIKPSKNNTSWIDAVRNVVPDIQETAIAAKKPINNLDDLDNIIKLTKDRVWKSYSNLLGPNADQTIDGTSIGQAMLESIDKRTAIQNPSLVDKLLAKAKTYQRPLTLAEAEDFLQSANNELHSYYAKNKVGQKVAASDPDIAPVLAEAGALRDALYSKINELTGKDAALLKKKYGDLTNIQNEVIARKNVAARQNPDSLATQISGAQAVGDVAESVANLKFGSAIKGAAKFTASKYLQAKNSTDGLIQSAFSRLGKRR